MATYLQGVTDYIPQIQPWTPDYNFYQGALDRKQQQYDIGWERANTLYNSLLNASMMRNDNIQTRDNFFKSIEQSINRLSGIDLSIPQNVDAASQLFTPLIENKYVVNDINWTKRYQNEMQQSEYFRNCTDPKRCGGKYWEEGVRALNYMAEDFRNASADQALNMQAPRYVPYTNVVEKAFDMIKDQKFGTKIQSISPDGKYIVTEKNGMQMIEPLMSYLAGTLGNDPAVMDMYKTKAYVQRKDWIHGNQNQYGSLDEAEAAYFQSLVQPAVSVMENVNNDIRADRKTKEADVNNMEKYIENNGVIPGSKEHDDYINTVADFDRLIGLEEQSNAELEVVQGIANSDNLEVMRMNSDYAVANALFFDDILNSALSYQQLTYEQELKEEPYALAAYRERLRFSYGVRRDDIKHKLDRDLWLFKEQNKLQKIIEGARGLLENNKTDWEIDPVLTKIIEEAADASGLNLEVGEDIEADIMTAQANFLAAVYNDMITMDADNINTWAWDFSKIFINDGEFKGVIGPEQWANIGLDTTYSDVAIKRLQDSNLNSLQPEDFLQLDADVINKMYKKAVNSINPSLTNNKYKDWAVDLWAKFATTRYDQEGIEIPSLKDQVDYSLEEQEIYSDFMRNLMYGCDDCPIGSYKKGGLNSTIKDMFLNGGVDDDGNQIPGWLNNTDVPFMGGIQESTILQDNVTDKEALLNLALDEFIDKDGYMVPYAEWSENVLKKALPWYGKEEGQDQSVQIPLIGPDGQPIQLPQTQPLQFPQNLEAPGPGRDDLFRDPPNTYTYLPNGMVSTPEGTFDANFIDPMGALNKQGPMSPREQYEAMVLRGARSTLYRMYYGSDAERESNTGKYGGVDRYGREDTDDNRRGAGWGLQDYHFYAFSGKGGEVIQSFLGGAGGTAPQMMVQRNIAPEFYTSEHYQDSKSLFKNIIDVGANDLKFSLGQDYNTIPANNEGGISNDKAYELVNAYSNYIYDNNWKKTDKNKPRFTVKYGTKHGAGDYAVAKIYFDRDWVKENAGSEKNPGITRRTNDEVMTELSENGLVVMIPTGQVNNNYNTKATADKLDMLVKSRGWYNWKDTYPLAGDIEVRYDKKKNGYYTAGTMFKYDWDGKLQREPIPLEWNQWLKNSPNVTFSSIKANWEPKLREYHHANLMAEMYWKSKNGVTDPELLKNDAGE